MKSNTKEILVRFLCWMGLVIIPTIAICWFFGIHNVGIIAIAIPFIVVAERVFRRWHGPNAAQPPSLSPVMRHPNIPDPLAEALESIARNGRWSVAYDTHYDAANAELRWWFEKTLNRVDFQPLQGGGIQVTHYTDRFRIFPRFMRWAWMNIPGFPYLATTNYRVLGKLSSDETEDHYAKTIQGYLSHLA